MVGVPESGEKSKSFGVFKNACCGREIVISVGAEFPPCPMHANRVAEWTQIEVEATNVRTDKSQSDPAA